jgi:hypothetical protein
MTPYRKVLKTSQSFYFFCESEHERLRNWRNIYTHGAGGSDRMFNLTRAGPNLVSIVEILSTFISTQ